MFILTLFLLFLLHPFTCGMHLAIIESLRKAAGTFTLLHRATFAFCATARTNTSTPLYKITIPD